MDIRRNRELHRRRSCRARVPGKTLPGGSTTVNTEYTSGKVVTTAGTKRCMEQYAPDMNPVPWAHAETG